MKKLLISFITVALTTTSVISFAVTETVKVETVKVENVKTVKETVSGDANVPVVAQPENKHAGAANTPVDQKPNQPTVVRVEKVERVKQENSDSVYENIRSGWNRFIDLLAGPKQ